MKDNGTKNTVTKKSRSKGPNFFVKIGRKFKEVFSELKKVSWPSFSKVVKQTAIVIGVVLVFMVFVTIVDFGLSKLLDLLASIGG